MLPHQRHHDGATDQLRVSRMSDMTTTSATVDTGPVLLREAIPIGDTDTNALPVKETTGLPYASTAR